MRNIKNIPSSNCRISITILWHLRSGLTKEISKSSTHRNLLKHKLYPFSISLSQHLEETDLPTRFPFWEIIVQHDFPILDIIIWMEEATFMKKGFFNQQNSHFWCDWNSYAVVLTCTLLHFYQKTLLNK